jgi:hypothetical protein
LLGLAFVDSGEPGLVLFPICLRTERTARGKVLAKERRIIRIPASLAHFLGQAVPGRVRRTKFDPKGAGEPGRDDDVL